MAEPRKRRPRRPIFAAVPKGYDPTRITQLIKSEDLFENLILDPQYVPLWYVDNIISRVLARITGQGPTGPVVIRCTEDGSLAVVARGGAFDAYTRLDKFFTSKKDGASTDTLANKLKDTGADFVTAGIAVGDSVINRTDTTSALVTAIDSATVLSIDADIFVATETYSIVTPYTFQFTRQMTRLDIFTYNGLVDYQLSRDLVQPLGDKIELFEDSFYSLDIYVQQIKATPTTWSLTKPTKSRVLGWYRLED